jgi:hypothetical protein
LHSVDIPVSALVCDNHLYNDARHLRDLNEYCVSIVNSCTIAAEQCIPVTCKIGEKHIYLDGIRMFSLTEKKLCFGIKYGLIWVVHIMVLLWRLEEQPGLLITELFVLYIKTKKP